MTKAPTPTEMSNGQSDNTKTPQKSSIKQRLRTDLGRSVGVTTATQLVVLTWFTGLPSNSPQKPCNQKDTQKGHHIIWTSFQRCTRRAFRKIIP